MKHQLLCPITYIKGSKSHFRRFWVIAHKLLFLLPQWTGTVFRIIYDWNKGISPIMVDFKLWRRFHPFFIIRTIKRMQLINTHEIFLKMQKWVLKGSKFNSGWFWVIKQKIVLFISKLDGNIFKDLKLRATRAQVYSLVILS